MMNLVAIDGKVAFDVNYTPANGDKKAFAVLTLNVNTGVKDAEGKYWIEERIKLKGFGGTADRLNGFKQNDYIVVNGKLSKGTDWTDNEGNAVAGQWEIIVLNVANFGTKGKEDEESTASAAPAVQSAKPASTKPASTKPAPAKAASAKPAVKKVGIKRPAK